jgi:NAD(P)H-dependent flavin oxidoreductase YrpB (nitropropane dioxygenase family)
VHRAALLEADDACALVTDVISGRPCRYIRDKLIDDLIASGLKPLPVPAQQSLTLKLSDTGDRAWTALTSGQSAALARATKAAELIERLADETTRRPALSPDDPVPRPRHIAASVDAGAR